MSSLIGDFSQKRLLNCGLRQYEVERVFGYEHPHTFAIEACLHSPSQEFLSRFTKWLHLDEVEFSEILQAAKTFRRQLVLPNSFSKTDFTKSPLALITGSTSIVSVSHGHASGVFPLAGAHYVQRQFSVYAGAAAPGRFPLY